MGKDDTIGLALWESYSEKVKKRMDNPKNRGEITEEEAAKMGAKLVVADWGAEACGDAVRLFWAVDPETNVVKLARFKSFGCGTAIAACDVTCDMTVGKTVEDCLKITNLTVESSLRDTPDKPAIPPQKMHCSVMSHDVLKKVVSVYKGVDVDSLEDQEMVCACARVSLGTIKTAIRLNDLKSVDDITRFTKAGAFCKSCIRPGGHEAKKYYLVDIIRETRTEIEKERLIEEQRKLREKIREARLAGKFREMTLFKKMAALGDVIDRLIRPMLAKDGGDCELIDFKEIEGRFKVFIEYGGACATCQSATSSTLGAIEETLRSQLDEPAIDVEPMFP